MGLNWERNKMERRLKEERRLQGKFVSPETRLWFGKYYGKQIKDVPVDYVRWCIRNKIIEFRR